MGGGVGGQSYEFDGLEDELKKAEKEAKETCQRVKEVLESHIPDKAFGFLM